MPQALTEEQRAKLDGIVQQMQANGEPDENIQTVVNDFKAKNSGGMAAHAAEVNKTLPKWYEPGGDQLLDNVRMLAKPGLAGLAASALTGGAVAIPAAVAGGTSVLRDALNQESPMTTGLDALGNAGLAAAPGAAMAGLKLVARAPSAALDVAEWIPGIGGYVTKGRKIASLGSKALEKLAALAEDTPVSGVGQKAADASARIHPTPPLKPQGIAASEVKNADLLDKFATMMQSKGAEVIPEAAQAVKAAAQSEAVKAAKRQTIAKMRQQMADNPSMRKALEGLIKKMEASL